MAEHEQVNRVPERPLEEYWREAYPIVTAYIAASVRNQHDVDDVVQEVALAVAQDFARYDSNQSFVRWALSISHKRILKYHRTRSNDRHIFDSETSAALIDAAAIDAMRLKDMVEALNECIPCVKGKAAEVLKMRYFREMSPSHISHRMGMTTNAVLVTLHRARAVLEECIKRRMTAQR